MFADDESLFAHAMISQQSSDMCVYNASNILGVEATAEDSEILPMTEAVKHPNVMVVIAVRDFGPGSTGLLKDLHNVCEVSEVWGGRILVVLPYLAKAWVDHAFFAKFCFVFHILYIDRADEEMGFATNDYVIRQALHGGDWNHTEGVAEARALFWADAEWGDDQEDVEGIHYLTDTTPRERLTIQQGMAKVRNSTTPAFPCQMKDPTVPNKHRQNLVTSTDSLPLAVARKVKRQEIEREPKARAAVDLEFQKLATQSHPDGKGHGVWDIKSVREKRDVRWEANKANIVVFFAMIAELCFQKGSELEDGHPGKVYKGRHVLLGDQVVCNEFDTAQFQELGSSPPSMMASRVIDAWSLFKGYIMTQSDAFSAYTQWFIGGGRDKGVPTWVSLPRHRGERSGKASTLCTLT